MLATIKAVRTPINMLDCQARSTQNGAVMRVIPVNGSPLNLRFGGFDDIAERAGLFPIGGDMLKLVERGFRP